MPRWGRFFRNIWYLTGPYFRSNEKWSAIGLLVLVLAADIALVRINVLLNLNGGAWVNAFQQYDEPAFYRLLLTYDTSPEGPFGIIPGFVPLVTLALLIFVNGRYLRQWLTIRWRRWLTAHYQEEWLSGRAYYQMQLQAETLGNDNPDQRLSEDVRDFVENGLVLGFGFIANIVSLASFLAVLWALSFPVTILGLRIPAYLVWVALLYSLVGTLLAQLIGRPLVSLNYLRQRLEANFRYALIRLRENAEGVALYSGERDEGRILTGRFGAIVANYRAIMSRNRLVNAFTYFFAQVAAIFPFFAASPLYFSKQISFGTLSRVAGAFSEVQGAASWIVDNYMGLADWAATVERLATFGHSLDAMRASESGIITVRGQGQDFVARDLVLKLPNGGVLMDGGELHIGHGHSTVLRGRSGAGKSTLFRAIAGIWPFGRGTVERPAGQIMFLPQKPYIPLGTLRRVVTYPAAMDAYSSEVIGSALAAAGLGGLAAELDVDMAWGQRLSGGEQQRLAFARALLARPDWLFMDEATASLDPQAEAELYQMLREHLPETTVVSIAHRPEIATLHDTILTLERTSAGGSLIATPSS